MPNERNEIYLAFNFERIRYWLGQGADISTPVAEILGDAGFLPIHPRRYMTSWRNRVKEAAEAAEKLAKEEEAREAARLAALAAQQKENSSETKTESEESKPEST